LEQHLRHFWKGLKARIGNPQAEEMPLNEFSRELDSENKLHSLLKKQILKHFKSGGSDSPELEKFLLEVNEAYRQADEDYETLEHAMDVTSGELMEKNRKLLKEIEGKKEVQRELEKGKNQLGIRVQERTAELEKSKEEAERANRAKSEFLARMSHELRTPLNSILGFAQILLQKDPDSTLKEHGRHLNIIHDSGKHLLMLISEILDLSKIEAGEMDVNIVPTHISHLVDEVGASTQSLCSEKGVRFVNEIPSKEKLVIDADPFRLKQVFLNLVSNAIKYNKEGGTVSVCYSELPENWVRLNVIDTGKGIPQEKLDSLFEPFNRFDADYKAIDGVGIGLTISKKLVELMSGRIGFTSEFGKGSCFYVDFPLSFNENEKSAETNDVKPE